MTITPVGEALPALTRTTGPTRPATRQVLAWAFQGTPGRLRAFGAIAILTCLVFSGFALLAGIERDDSLGHARAAAAQLVRIETIRTSLVSADASLTNAFLVGGLEPKQSQAGYQSGITNATTALSQAANANAGDAAKLRTINTAIAQYTGLIASAQAYNRQGFPIGQAYLSEATQLLRTDALTPLERLSKDVQHRVDNAYDDSSSAAYWLIVGVVVSLLALLALQLWLSRRMRRSLNLPVLAATVLVVVTAALLGGAMFWSQHKADDTRKGAYFTTLELTTARTDAFDAKSDESLTLINRGSGQAYEQDFQALQSNITAILASAGPHTAAAADAQRGFARYLALHKQIRAADDGGNWQRAVDLAIGTSSTDANALFASFDRASATALAQQSSKADGDLGSARSPLVPLGTIALIGGLLAAVGVWWGITGRLREYR